MEKWNEKYKERINANDIPSINDRLLSLFQYLKGGIAVDIASGLGTNSLYLAENGFEVTAIDASDVAIHYVQQKAKERNLLIHTKVMDTKELALSSLFNPYSVDFVIITNYLDRNLFPYAKTIIKVGGHVFIETFYETPNLDARRISNKFLLKQNELLQLFDDWHILYFEENEHEGRQTLFARKQR